MSEDIPFTGDNMYSNLFGYRGLPLVADPTGDGIDAAVMGIPYDLGTSGRSGARFGPNGVRQASANVRWEEARWPWDFELGDKLMAVDCGDINFLWGDSADMLRKVEERAHQIVSAGKTLFSIGGDHFVTLPLLRAHAKVHGKMALIHFDAHTDSYEEEQEYNHGCMFYRAPREGLIDSGHSVQIGIRTDYERETHEFLVLDAHTANEQSVDALVASIRDRVGDMPAYLTFDIDCLDPAYAPGTGTPVVGGLSTSRVLRILQGIADLNIVGFDLVEVAPAYDHADITALAGATLLLEFMHMRASR